MDQNFDWNTVIPFIVLAIPWFMAANSIYTHFRHGYMTAYLRKGAGDHGSHEQPTSYETNPKDHPISYWILLIFYLAIVVLVPVIMFVVAF